LSQSAGWYRFELHELLTASCADRVEMARALLVGTIDEIEGDTVSRLMKHAEYELKKAGLFYKDSVYNGMIGKTVMRLVKAHAKEGRSSGSHEATLQVFN